MKLRGSLMIKIVCVGKIKEQYLTEMIDDYQKRISKYHKLEIIEVKDVGTLESEKVLIEKYLDARDYIITLEIFGKEYSSEEFAMKIESIFNHYPNITFVIGSSLGLHEDIKNRANLALSFSKFTFPHGLFRGILLEQIYRAFKILNHETYHK